MARANGHFIPGHLWHLTHRCHKREFLFKFSKDRSRWIELLFKAFPVVHPELHCHLQPYIHLIVSSNRESESIPRAMQLIAGRSGQEYNRRKGRKGAFWEDRYHATAIESGEHLWWCLVYVDLNMVRAGVVEHPGQWKWSGYHEIQKPKTRYRLIDHDKLRGLLNADTNEALAQTHRGWVESQLKTRPMRQAHFGRSLAVGSEAFIRSVKQALGIRATGRRFFKTPSAGYQLKESIGAYGDADSD
jgi:putative transposase